MARTDVRGYEINEFALKKSGLRNFTSADPITRTKSPSPDRQARLQESFFPAGNHECGDTEAGQSQSSGFRHGGDNKFKSADLSLGSIANSAGSI
jgi:hypothetical protein